MEIVDYSFLRAYEELPLFLLKVTLATRLYTCTATGFNIAQLHMNFILLKVLILLPNLYAKMTFLRSNMVYEEGLTAGLSVANGFFIHWLDVYLRCIILRFC